MKQQLEYKVCFPAKAGIQTEVADQSFYDQFESKANVSLLTLVPASHYDMLKRMAYIGVDFPNGETKLIHPKRITTDKQEAVGITNGQQWKWATVPEGSSIATHENQLVGLPMVAGG